MFHWRHQVMSENKDFLFVKGPDTGSKNGHSSSEPNDYNGSQKIGDILFVKGVDTIKRTH
jgi:hypothetical protein